MGPTWTKVTERKQSQGRIFLLNPFAETPCLAPLGVELSRTPGGTQPGVSLLMSFESQSPRILISVPCAVTQANSGSARQGVSVRRVANGRGGSSFQESSCKPKEFCFRLRENTPFALPPTSPGCRGRGSDPSGGPSQDMGAGGQRHLHTLEQPVVGSVFLASRVSALTEQAGTGHRTGVVSLKFSASPVRRSGRRPRFTGEKPETPEKWNDWPKVTESLKD